MHEILTEFLWNIHTDRLNEQSMVAAKAENIDAIKNISLSKQLFDNTLLSAEFKCKPKKSVLKQLVHSTLEKYSKVSTWLKDQENETLLYTLLVNYRIITT